MIARRKMRFTTVRLSHTLTTATTMADRDVSHKETTRRTSRLACSPFPRAAGRSSPYSVLTMPTLQTPAQSLGYEEVVEAVAADAHSASRPPPSTHIDDALRNALVRLDDDVQTGQLWAQNAGRASALLSFFDLESRVLRVANTAPGHAFLGCCASDATYECTELVGPSSPSYLGL
ncbi:hypothetical protein H4582DRAFT_308965 [Lactarius indigo]|nr:hypothetical protein H4582DRAFT_308965 [Lactarius indigo]